MSLRQLLELGHLGLSVLAGADGLDRDITWAHVSEMDNPAEWLEGGELLLTAGHGLPRTHVEQLRYVTYLIDRGVVGLVVPQADQPILSDEALKLADEARFPIVEISFGVPFIAITKTVAAAGAQDLRDGLLRDLRIFATLRAATEQSFSTGRLIQQLEQAASCELYACDRHGDQLLEELKTPPPELLAHLPHGRDRSPVFDHGYVVPIVLAHEPVGYLIARERQPGHARLASIQHVATILAVEWTNARRELEAERREGAETLSMTLLGEISPAAQTRRLFQIGFNPDSNLQLVVLNQSDAADSMLNQRLRVRSIPHQMLRREALIVLCEEHEVARVVELSGASHVGASLPFGHAALMAPAKRQAEWSLNLAQRWGRQVVKFSERHELSSWLPLDEAGLRRVVKNVLGPVLAYDAEQGTELIDTLHAYFAHDRRHDVTARRLDIHKHTLAYRLKSIERITGRQLSSVEATVDFWLGLRAIDMLRAVDENPTGALDLLHGR